MFLSLRCFCFRFLYGKISSARRKLNRHCADMKPAIRSTLLPSTIIEWKLLFVNFEWQFENRAQTFCSSDLAVDFVRKHINFSKQMEFPNWSAMFSWFIFWLSCVSCGAYNRVISEKYSVSYAISKDERTLLLRQMKAKHLESRGKKCPGNWFPAKITAILKMKLSEVERCEVRHNEND